MLLVNLMVNINLMKACSCKIGKSSTPHSYGTIYFSFISMSNRKSKRSKIRPRFCLSHKLTVYMFIEIIRPTNLSAMINMGP